MSANKDNSLNQRFELLVIFNEFKNDIFNFRKKWFIGDDFLNNHYYDKKTSIEEYRKSSSYKKDLRHLKNSNAWELLGTDIRKILKKFNLSERYLYPLETYIFSNKIVYLSSLEYNVRYNDNNINTPLEAFDITVYPETAKEEFIELWDNQILKWQNKCSTRPGKRIRQSEDYEFRKRIWQLYNDGVKQSEIWTTVNAEFNKSNSFSGKDLKVGYPYINRVVRDIVKRIFGSKKQKKVKREILKT